MARGPDKAPALARPQSHVHFFERTEKTGEGLFQMGRATSRLAEILRPELILARDYRSAQRPVFMRSLSPGEFGIPVDPQRETHVFS